MEVPREERQLKDNPRLLSPPMVVEPLYGCSTIVNVRGFVLNAALDVEVAGGIVVTSFPGSFPEPWGPRYHCPLPCFPDRSFGPARDSVPAAGIGPHRPP